MAERGAASRRYTTLRPVRKRDHYVFPRECPFPHKAGTLTAKSPLEFGDGVIVTKSEVESHAEQPQDYSSAMRISPGLARGLTTEDIGRFHVKWTSGADTGGNPEPNG